MISYNQIERIHLELSSLCNAECPLCPRNFRGYPYNDGYPEVNLSLDNVRKIFNETFLNQLTQIRINGNYGDFVMNPESVDIIKYFLTNNNIHIEVNTNGSARSTQFWKELGELGITINFAIDGLEDTHHLYRKNTSYKNILKNAKTFIEAGGIANWKMIKFLHNEHQIDQCKELASVLNFNNFFIVDSSRNSGPVFDKKGQLLHVIGNYNGETNFKKMFFKKKTDMVLLEDIVPDKIPKTTVKCETQSFNEVYITSNGELYPCCFTGFYPRTYGKGEYHEAVNSQLKPLVGKNNLLLFSIEECLEWFSEIKSKWKITSYESGRLVVCDDNCGSN